MKPLVAIYYRRQDWEAIKDLVSRARNDGAEVRPVWANMFKGAKSMLVANAVIIQQEASNADTIIKCYGALGNNVEVHLCTVVDGVASFVPLEGDDSVDNQPQPVTPDPVVPEKADSNAGAFQDIGAGSNARAYVETSEADGEPEDEQPKPRSKRRSRKSVQDDASDNGGGDGEDSGAE